MISKYEDLGLQAGIALVDFARATKVDREVLFTFLQPALNGEDMTDESVDLFAKEIRCSPATIWDYGTSVIVTEMRGI